MTDVINSNTPEYVAYLLMENISSREDMPDRSDDIRKDLLNLYAECLDAVKGQRPYK